VVGNARRTLLFAPSAPIRYLPVIVFPSLVWTMPLVGSTPVTSHPVITVTPAFSAAARSFASYAARFTNVKGIGVFRLEIVLLLQVIW